MAETINVLIRQGKHDDLFDYLTRQKRDGYNYTESLTALVEENKRLNQEVVKQNDWTGMRLALRATEKNSHLTIELLNNMLLARPIQAILTIEEKSQNLVKAERDWKNYIQELQAERSTKKKVASKVVGSQIPMPEFDFEEVT
jgi:23S rRNA G2069 N7-methylase RlmK/C1962 C5-methylase RlmI